MVDGLSNEAADRDREGDLGKREGDLRDWGGGVAFPGTHFRWVSGVVSNRIILSLTLLLINQK